MAKPPADTPRPSAAGHFTGTRWSLVRRAGSPEDPESAEALEGLCRIYWPAVYGFLRRKGHPRPEAQDLTQGFFELLLRRADLGSTHPDRGRFRTWLLVSLQHYLADQWDRAQALKRGGGQLLVSLDDEEAAEGLLATAPEESPERIFDQQWAARLLSEAVVRLQAEFKAADKRAIFEELRPFLTQEAGPDGYDAVAQRLNLRPGTVAVTVHRLRARYRRLVQEVVRETVADSEDARHEFHALFLTP
jgi:RNA polymerase sigma factor (sigma-70 family)